MSIEVKPREPRPLERLRAFVFRNRFIFVLDVVALLTLPTLALLIRLDLPWHIWRFFIGLAFYTSGALLLRLLTFYFFGLYRRHWRYASIDDLLQIVLAVVFSTLLIAAVFLGSRTLYFFEFPRSVILIDALLVSIYAGGVRLSARLVHDRLWRHVWRTGEGQQRVLIMGAGSAGTLIVREIDRNPALGMEVVGFLDDDSDKHGLQILSRPVFGGREDIASVVSTRGIGLIIIAMPTAPGSAIREIVRLCEQVGVQTKIMPGMYELLDGTVGIQSLRDVALEDLLRREPIHTDTAAVADLLRGKKVLVTGGGGSIGSELCRQVLRAGPSELVIVGHGENSVFSINLELRALQNRTQITPVIADIRSAERIHNVLAAHRPDVIFHAAAHKHVFLMETNPVEAVTNNVLGTRNVLDAALANDVQRFVMISTDKAVNPTSMMGATKRAAELLVHRAAQASGRPYVAVRFGNVLGSRGSVIPIFEEQIAAGGPVTVTHPEMKRFFMTIPEAVQLVLQAAVLGRGGEVFVLDMGEPVRIADMARDLIELSGLTVGDDIDIVFTGAHAGEKLFEELFIPGERYERTRHEKIFIAANASHLVPDTLEATVATLERASREEDTRAIRRALQNLIPEYQPSPARLAASQAGVTPPPVGSLTTPPVIRAAR